jgi:hypothetical protein
VIESRLSRSTGSYGETAVDLSPPGWTEGGWEYEAAPFLFASIHKSSKIIQFLSLLKDRLSESGNVRRKSIRYITENITIFSSKRTTVRLLAHECEIILFHFFCSQNKNVVWSPIPTALSPS